MKLYNYLHRVLEPFHPIYPNYVGMYVCGPTVYGEPHLGHARSAITFDLLYRYLQHKKYKVRYVRNITDVGHLEDETLDRGEDKLERVARLTRMTPMEVAHYYTVQYHHAMDALAVLSPSIEPTASGHILEQQQYIEALLSKGWAYRSEGNVYFDTKKFVANHEIYGMLSGKDIEHLLSGQRTLKNQEGKRNAIDFALWKTVNDNQIMHWKSPWNERGVPGWHTECCAMSKKYLGLPFDIHGGGLDLQFPHHEAEIAQSYALHGNAPAKYWLYNNMITIDHQKMSKSLNNFITLDMFFNGTHERLSQSYTPQVIRFFLLRSHYRSVIDISDDALQGAIQGFTKLQYSAGKAYRIIQQHAINKNSNELIDISGTAAKDLQQSFTSCMDDDLNTPQAIACLFEGIDYMNSCQEINTDPQELSYAYIYNECYSSILGLTPHQPSHQHQIPSDVKAINTLETLVAKIVEIRSVMRVQKEFEQADSLRKLLLDIDIEITDEPDGSSTWHHIT